MLISSFSNDKKLEDSVSNDESYFLNKQDDDVDDDIFRNDLTQTNSSSNINKKKNLCLILLYI